MTQCPQPDAAYNVARLQTLLDRVRDALPQARPSTIVQGSFDFTSTMIAFDNGLEVLVALDADLPLALYEIIRFVQPRDVNKYSFETRGTLGAAYSDKLSTEAALPLLQDYAAQPVDQRPEGRA